MIAFARALRTLLLVAALATAPVAVAQDITNVDIHQTFNFATLNDANLAANDNGNIGTWTVDDVESDLSMSTSAEMSYTGLINGNSDSGGSHGLAMTTPAATFNDTVVKLEFTVEQETCVYGWLYQFPAGFVGSDEEHDLLYVQNNFGTQQLYVKHTDHDGGGSPSDLFLYTGEAGYSSPIDISGLSGTPLWITALHQTGGAGSPHRLRVYNPVTGAQIGSEQTRTSHASEPSHTVNLGSAVGPLQGHTGSVYFDDFVIDCSSPQWPMLPPIATGTTEQEGFRWGIDDDTESAHTFEANQDTNITIADDQSRLLRVLVDGTDDPSSVAYTLYAQKNGSGGYSAVNVGASTKTTPVIEAADATESGNNTASSSWSTVAFPNASTGDLLIPCLSWDDSTSTTGVTPPSGPNGETFTQINATPATDSGTETRSKCWYTVATGSWSAGNRTFTPSASESWTGAVIRVPAGEFDASTPIGAAATNGAAGTAESNIQHAGSFSAGASDGGGKLAVWTSADADAQTVASGFTQVANTDRGDVSGGLFTRDTVVSNSESFSATTVSTIASDSWSTVAFVVRAPTVNNEVYVTASANITAGGEATTARLTAPGAKTSSDFTTGRRWDDENGSDSIDIAEDFYTELEWSVFIASSAADNDFYDFRVYAGAAPLDTYTVTPRWTVDEGGGSSPVRAIIQQLMGREPANDSEYDRRLVANAR